MSWIQAHWGQPVHPAYNEAVLSYAPGSAERDALQAELATQTARTVDIPLVIGGMSVHTETRAEVVQQVGEVSTLVAAIASASRDQAQAIVQAGQAIQAMDQGTQQNAAVVEQTSAAAEALRQQADQLSRLVQRFQLD